MSLIIGHPTGSSPRYGSLLFVFTRSLLRAFEHEDLHHKTIINTSHRISCNHSVHLGRGTTSFCHRRYNIENNSGRTFRKMGFRLGIRRTFQFVRPSRRTFPHTFLRPASLSLRCEIRLCTRQLATSPIHNERGTSQPIQTGLNIHHHHIVHQFEVGRHSDGRYHIRHNSMGPIGSAQDTPSPCKREFRCQRPSTSSHHLPLQLLWFWYLSVHPARMMRCTPPKTSHSKHNRLGGMLLCCNSLLGARPMDRLCL